MRSTLRGARAKRFIVPIVTALALAVFVPAEAASGDFDPSFGIKGRTFTDFGVTTDAAFATLTDFQGSILVGGASGGRLAIAKYRPDGLPDLSWGTLGRVTTDVGVPAVITDMAFEPNSSKIVVAGSIHECCDRYHLLARYNVDGTLDASFGSGGIVTFHFLGDRQDFFDPQSLIARLAIQLDGKILLAGTAERRFALARFATDGTVEQLFPPFATSLFSVVGDLVLLPNGRIIVAGWGPNADWIFDRYYPWGSLDETWGSGGRVVIDVGNDHGELRAAQRQPDGKIVAAGFFSVDDGIHSRFILARLQANGTLDPAFSGNGITTTWFPHGIADAIALQSDGRLVAVGSASDPTIGSTFALARYRPNGDLDWTFGRGGKTRSIVGLQSRATAIAIDRFGRIVVAGTGRLIDDDFVVARYQG